ncbi:phenoloxidase-activating factor 2-like [Zerene cesonia]|uniref:phenoloxidase-activating factor 2-like n=1 Tax=Zerene cesonia TaxID=33412 RepID=UPI0018E4FAC5|nr:phenoloxidase-activating factor 2-like [Zerene cesonia]
MKYLQLLLLLTVSRIHCFTLDKGSMDWLNSFMTTPTPSVQTPDNSDECLTQNQERGRCVKPSQCSDKDDDDSFDLSKIKNVLRINSCHYLLMCCPRKQIITQPTTAAPPVTEAPRVGCGWSSPSLTNVRMLGTEYADFGEYPWMVALLRKSSQMEILNMQSDYLGGGSLIHPSVVMTAAHKVVKVSMNELKCRAGEWDTQTLNEEYEYQERDVAKIITHEGYNPKKGLNNIALLVLEKPFNLAGAPNVGIACLGQSIPSDGTTCISMGWGQEEFNNANKYAVILKKVQLPIYNRGQCQTNLRKYKDFRKWEMDGSLMCAGGEEGAPSRYPVVWRDCLAAAVQIADSPEVRSLRAV